MIKLPDGLQKEYAAKYVSLKHRLENARISGDKKLSKHCRQSISALYNKYADRQISEPEQQWQFRDANSGWEACAAEPCWAIGLEYRIKPEKQHES